MTWWTPDTFARNRPHLAKRSAILADVRRFFSGRGFVEVETPALQTSPGIEPHIQPFATELREPFAQGARTLYLHTSPEFAMKKLLVAGMPRIFQLARVFRNGERSDTHHPEFTMLEWYRSGADYRDLMTDCEDLLRSCADAAGVAAFVRRGRRCDPGLPWRFLTVAEAFRSLADIDLLATVADPDDPDPPPAALAAEARRIGVSCADGDRWEDIFFRIALDRIEPLLGDGAPTILHDYPACMAALSRRKPGDARVAERFELYVCGVELANAFSELTDPVEQRRRFAVDTALRERLYGGRLPVDEDFLSALAFGLPASAGIALGFDRLVMLAAGVETIEEVLWAPVAE
ncbi:MAG: EF-P lysine aminoacylase GenX [Alphaproteobacteria bacterium]|nr:EF-P lysine aminoacylase GenX [Alphaproteobacteria bacterium]